MKKQFFPYVIAGEDSCPLNQVLAAPTQLNEQIY
jgi:hypothetical protein